MNAEHHETMLKRFEDATRAGRTDDEAFRGIEAILRDHASFPFGATLLGMPVIVESFEYRGPRLGVMASVVRRNRRYGVSVLELEFAPELAIIHCQELYRRWSEAKPEQRTSVPPGGGRQDIRDPAPGSATGAVGEEILVLAIHRRHASCRLLRSQKDAFLHLGSYESGQLIPGEILTLATRKTWVYGTRLHVSGSLLAHRFDVSRLGLVPLQLRYRGEWDPREFFEDELAGKAERDMPDYYLPILAAGVRPEYEMDQVIPGSNPTDDDDPIVRAAGMHEYGDHSAAREILMRLLAEDLRCVDAYAHLGNLELSLDAEHALRYYRAGMDIAELSLPAGFSGLLPWSHLDNRPYLRCLHGAGLCHWRLGRREEAEEAFERLLWLSPNDNQGARMLIEDVRAGRSPHAPG